jgi:hypothetical protein
MSVQGAFVQAWRDWLRVAPPIKNSRQRRFNAPTYQVEVVLDHLESRLYEMGMAILGGKDLDFARFEWEELCELDRVSRELESLALTQEGIRSFYEYISASRALLEQIGENASVPHGGNE